MTDAQCKVQCKQDYDNALYEKRKFRKECVTLGIVKFVRGHVDYEIYYRGFFICTLFKDQGESLKLMAVWNAIRIAEESIEKIEGVKHDC